MLRARLFLALALCLALLRSSPLRCLVAPTAVTFTVDTSLDQIDDDTTDGVCRSDPDRKCTLRAAIMQANRVSDAGATIIVPSGAYPLTRPAAGADGDTS